MKNLADINSSQKTIADLSKRLVEIQTPIRILNSIKWDDTIKRDFFDAQFKKLPAIDKAYYQKNELNFEIETKIDELRELQLLIQSKLGSISPLSQILLRACKEYQTVVYLIAARGTKRFGEYSKELYGSATDPFYIGGPDLTHLANILNATLPALESKTENELDIKQYSADEAANILTQRLSSYFNDPNEKITVETSGDIVADAAAGAEVIKLKQSARFSERELRSLEVHEGWVHLGTTLNGRCQPICGFLAKGTPSSTITQEGLAFITELFTFSASPARLKRICNRINAINMVDQGANFIDVFNYLREQGIPESDSYDQTVRVFRGSLPDGSCGAFTKDVSYSKGFIQIYNYIRLAIKNNVSERIPLLFTGKLSLKDIPVLADLLEQKLLVPPKYIPPQFRDLAGLTSLLSFSLFFNKIDLTKLEQDYKNIL